jgi:hypothetical protein
MDRKTRLRGGKSRVTRARKATAALPAGSWFSHLLLWFSLFTGYYWWGTPPPPRSFGIIGLGGNSSQVFEFKGLTAKVFENQ